MAAASPTPHDPYAAFRIPAYRNYAIGGFISVIGRQMLALAVGFEVFRRTHSATALGLVGLMGALPVILLSLPAGQVSDRLSRKWIILTTQALLFVTSLGLALLSWENFALPASAPLAAADRWLYAVTAFFGEKNGVVFGPELPVIYLLLLLNGTARAFGWAARSPFVANIVPRESLANAAIWNSSTFEIGTILGPAMGGFLIAFFGFAFVYLLDAICSVVFIAFVLPIRYEQARTLRDVHPLRDLFSGIRFVWDAKPILATLTLDLFAVLLGGATALLPIYADRILHVGPLGLGWLRAAPSLGAVTMALTLAHLPPMRRAGLSMLWAVGVFGAATVVFGLSQSFWLSMIALILTGACDNISVVVRHTLVQLLTPDPMRGRVSAVNNVFIGSSNELGAFESGITAAKFEQWVPGYGAQLSVIFGGIGAILVVLGVVVKWPQVRQIGQLHQVAEIDRETA